MTALDPPYLTGLCREGRQEPDPDKAKFFHGECPGNKRLPHVTYRCACPCHPENDAAAAAGPPACCDWCGVCGGETVLVAESVDGTPAHACRSCWDSPALALVRAVDTARRDLAARVPGALARAELGTQAVHQVLTREATPLTPRDIEGQDMRPGDGLNIGGATFIVIRTTPVADGVQLRFLGGELLTIQRHTHLAVMRPVPGWPHRGEGQW